MKKVITGFSIISMLAICCNFTGPESKFENAIVFLGGTNWISRTYLDSLDTYGTPAQVNNARCLEICFSHHADSLCIIEGGRNISVFKVSFESDSMFQISGFEESKHTLFRLSGGGKILSYHDRVYGTEVYFTKLEKKYAVKNISGWQSGSELFMNERIFAANYWFLNPENKPSMHVVFTSYGEVAGLANYKSFQVCYDTRCSSNSGLDIIRLSDGKTTDRYNWQWSSDTLYFYSIVYGSSKSSPEFGRGEEIFKFIKKL